MKNSVFFLFLFLLPVAGAASDPCSKEAIAARENQSIEDVWDSDVDICRSEAAAFARLNASEKKSAEPSNNSAKTKSSARHAAIVEELMRTKRTPMVLQNIRLSQDTPSDVESKFASLLQNHKNGSYQRISLEVPSMSFVDYAKLCNEKVRLKNRDTCEDFDKEVKAKLRELSPNYRQMELSVDDINACSSDIFNFKDIADPRESLKMKNRIDDVIWESKSAASSYCKLHKLSKEKATNIASSSSYSCQSSRYRENPPQDYEDKIAKNNLCSLMVCNLEDQKEICEVCLNSKGRGTKCFKRFEQDLAKSKGNDLKLRANQFLDSLSTSLVSFRSYDNYYGFLDFLAKEGSKVKSDACRLNPSKAYCTDSFGNSSSHDSYAGSR